jgi:uncharacterized protein (TIRG00374 family)
MSKRFIWNFIKLLIAGSIFYFLLHNKQLDPQNLEIAVRRFNVFACSVVLLIMGTLITVYRWRIILASQNIHLGFWQALKLTFVGYFFSTVLPGTIGGDFVKAYYLTKGEQEKTALVSSIFFDRLLGLYSLTAIAVVAVTTSFVSSRVSGSSGLRAQPVVLSLGIFIMFLFLGATLLAIVLLNRRFVRSVLIRKLIPRLPFRRITEKIFDTFLQFGENRKAIVYALALSVAASFISYVGLFVLAQMLGIREIKPLDYFFLLPVGMLTMAIPLAPSGLGVGEIGFSRLFMLFGSARGAEVAVMYHIIFLVTALGGGGLIYLFSDFNARQMKIQ